MSGHFFAIGRPCGFRNPEDVLIQLHARLQSDAQGSDQIRNQIARLDGLLEQKATERSRVVGLYRRGRLTDADLDAQMEEVGLEEAALEAQLTGLRDKIAAADSISATINSAKAFLAKLRKALVLDPSRAPLLSHDECEQWRESGNGRRIPEDFAADLRARIAEVGQLGDTWSSIETRCC